MTRPDWQGRLDCDDVLVLDGGTGSELRRRGVVLDPAAWSGLAPLAHYELLRTVHLDFIAAGADVITTSTFATTRFVLAAAGHDASFRDVNARAIAAALEARERAGREVAIAGSISCLPPHFDIRAYPDERAERAAYLELAETLAAGGVDLLLLEMMQEARHAPLAFEAARRTGLPVWLGVSCRLGADGALVGFDFPSVPLTAALDALLPFEPAAVCVMHSPVAAIAPALREIRGRFRGPLGAYPEIGDGSEHARDRLDPEALALTARSWLECGARILGGCCGTQPAHVVALAGVRAARQAKESD